MKQLIVHYDFTYDIIYGFLLDSKIKAERNQLIKLLADKKRS